MAALGPLLRASEPQHQCFANLVRFFFLSPGADIRPSPRIIRHEVPGQNLLYGGYLGRVSLGNLVPLKLSVQTRCCQESPGKRGPGARRFPPPSKWIGYPVPNSTAECIGPRSSSGHLSMANFVSGVYYYSPRSVKLVVSYPPGMFFKERYAWGGFITIVRSQT